jgi:hypothetical protein
LHWLRFGGLATAIAAVDAGVDVFVADSAGNDIGDDETNRYFGELSQDLRVPVHRGPAVEAPIRDDLAPAASITRRVEPFVGSRLRDWAASCLASPYGFLYSRVRERSAVTMRSSRGESFEVAAIGSIELGPDRPRVNLADWLSARAGLQVSVVRQVASRFGRVELLTTQPVSLTSHTTCRPTNRHLTDAARETRQSRSTHWRCGELQRYPPLGQ